MPLHAFSAKDLNTCCKSSRFVQIRLDEELREIETELERPDVLIVLLSAHSVHSEMVEHEVALAYRFGQAKQAAGGGKCLRILPVRLGYRQRFQYPLSRYLDPLNWAMWTGGHPYLTQQLCRALAERSVEDELMQGASWTAVGVAAIVSDTFFGEIRERDNNLLMVV